MVHNKKGTGSYVMMGAAIFVISIIVSVSAIGIKMKQPLKVEYRTIEKPIITERVVEVEKEPIVNNFYDKTLSVEAKLECSQSDAGKPCEYDETEKDAMKRYWIWFQCEKERIGMRSLHCSSQ